MELSLRWLGLIGLLGLLALVTPACEAKTPEVQPTPTPTPAPAPTPLTPKPGRLVDAKGQVSVLIPEQPGWECLEEAHGQQQATAVALRCRRQDRHEFLFLSAKASRQPPEQRTDAQTVLMSLYRADNEAFFQRVEYLDDHAATVAGAQGWEAELVAEHARLGSIRKRERLAIIGDRLFAISAEGAPEQWAAHEAEIERWFATVEFAH
ncbi:hypothetical protein DB30_07217 [Enhygromyxa salina]|uniref:Uncharacterized protein n=1 Tax=Enhygromyxa salina TaxID=215803 RepID=A0A0C2D6R8_9BACT|nr:hypothetical protein [Enhygromyxa salina]KIG18881.1 hypothetical protein DB30_07217 [Enhygromyxa salina]